MTFARSASLTKPAKTAPCHCIRCGGGGRVNSVVEGGICFRCRGTRVDPKYRDWAYPAAWSDEQCESHQAAVEEARQAKAKAKADAARASIVACWNDNLEACPALVEFAHAVQFVPGDEPRQTWPDVNRFWTDWESQFASDIVSKARRYRLSDKQVSLVESIRAKITERSTKAAIEAEEAVEAAPGRREIAGEVLAVKAYTEYYGHRPTTTIKILIRCDGFKAFGTAPASIADDVARGDRVALTATIKPKEAGFATFSRPTNATLTKPVSA